MSCSRTCASFGSRPIRRKNDKNFTVHQMRSDQYLHESIQVLTVCDQQPTSLGLRRKRKGRPPSFPRAEEERSPSSFPRAEEERLPSSLACLTLDSSQIQLPPPRSRYEP